jgi:hypothetical protein
MKNSGVRLGIVGAVNAGLLGGLAAAFALLIVIARLDRAI